MKQWAKQKGFTIVELLIVIVVIGILVAITIVAYSGIQQRGRDAQRKSDLAAMAKALSLYNVDKNNHATDNCGYIDGSISGGWYDSDYDGTGPRVSVSQCLIDNKYLSGYLIDPLPPGDCSTSGGNCHKYMKYTCFGTGDTYLYANLESVPHTANATDGTCQSAVDSNYGMNYYVKVN